jgi:transporter family-2 protein
VDRGVAVLLTAVVGGVLALQAPINAGLGRATGQLPAALISFTVGTLLLAAIVALTGEVGGVGSTFNVRWYYLIGGALGAAYVTVALIGVLGILAVVHFIRLRRALSDHEHDEMARKLHSWRERRGF